MTQLPDDHDARMARARLALDGLSVGDAFGERYFIAPAVAVRMIQERALPASTPWRWTDDTAMALSIVATLEDHGRIVQAVLAEKFADRYAREPRRGYGGGAHELLAAIGAGMPWRQVSSALFGGSGSYGNGGAMRVSPLGAYFADDAERAAEEAKRSSEITHAHEEGQAGAIAIAVAACWAWQQRDLDAPDVSALYEMTLAHTPDSSTRSGIEAARELTQKTTPDQAALALGSGRGVSSQDTVPFCIWNIARNPTSYVEAMWDTVSGFGDRDTTCAIVGGVVALSAGSESIPAEWLAAREPLPGRLD